MYVLVKCESHKVPVIRSRVKSAVGAVSCRPDHHRVLATDDAADTCAICVGHRGIYCAYFVLEK